MPLPLTVSCFSKIQIGFTFLVPAHPGSPGQRAVKRVCVCVWLYSEKAYKHRECNMFYVCVCYFGVLGGFWPSTASQFLTVVLENGFAWLVLCVYTDTGLTEIFLFCTFTYSCGLLYVTDSIAQIILIDCWTEAAVCSRRKRPKRRYVPNCLR